MNSEHRIGQFTQPTLSQPSSVTVYYLGSVYLSSTVAGALVEQASASDVSQRVSDVQTTIPPNIKCQYQLCCEWAMNTWSWSIFWWSWGWGAVNAKRLTSWHLHSNGQIAESSINLHQTQKWVESSLHVHVTTLNRKFNTRSYPP